MLLKLHTQNKLNYWTFSSCNYIFYVTEVWHIHRYTVDHKDLFRSLTYINEVSSKLSYLLTYLTAIPIGFVLTNQQENMDFFYKKSHCKKPKSFEVQWNLYKADTIGAKKCVRFIEIFYKIVWPQSKAIGSSLYCPYHRGVPFIVCPLYRDSTVQVFYIVFWNF